MYSYLYAFEKEKEKSPPNQRSSAVLISRHEVLFTFVPFALQQTKLKCLWPKIHISTYLWSVESRIFTRNRIVLFQLTQHVCIEFIG